MINYNVSITGQKDIIFCVFNSAIAKLSLISYSFQSYLWPLVKFDLGYET